MRLFLIVGLLVGCGDDAPVRPDAAIDALPIDGLPPGVPDFFGEACTPPSTVGVVNTCRNDLPYPKAYCTPAGICRPFCQAVTVSGGGLRACEDVGGVETYAFPTSAARVCYCEPK